ncbi:MAG: NAD(P)/FAD-dependent oxidoreductase [Desulfuromonadales bacterium]|nr:NAD(P)/FAD-dependent oxidoreductase [Desulfuromonadales bacterium]
MSKKRIVIAGMGFGGLSAGTALKNKDFEIIMVDRHNYHLFQPLLYQIATAGLEKESIAYPIRAFTRTWENTSFRMGEITGFDLEGKQLLTDTGNIDYDYLIVATGSRTNFFGNKNIEKYAFELKRLPQAEEIRNHILTLFEKATYEKDPVKQSELLTFVIVGGGPTGIEFAGALSELIRYVLTKDYPAITSDKTKIILIEATSSLLTAMPENLREYAIKKLQEMNVEVMLNTLVTDADANHVMLKSGVVINSQTLFWSAGVSAESIADRLGVEQGKNGCIIVSSDLSLEKYPEVFVVGDMAYVIEDDKPLPMLAPVASQQGKYVAKAIIAREEGEKIEPFKYVDKGSMATIGRSAAVATIRGFSFKGYFAWITWLVLHLYYLIGFRNRIIVLINWAYYYFSHERHVRLITKPVLKKCEK